MTKLRKWIKLLYSGDYKQCQGNMHAGDAYCCLGVAAEVLGAEWITDGIHADTGDVIYMNKLTDRTGGLEPHERATLGIPLSLMEDCVRWNDVQKLSFSEIAERLEQMEKLGIIPITREGFDGYFEYETVPVAQAS